MNRLTQPVATAGRWILLGLSVSSLVLVFQPLSQTLFALGCVLAFLSALTFNLMPFLEAGRPLRSVASATLVILAVLSVVVLLAALTAYGYVLYLQAK